MLVQCKILRLFVNTLTDKDKYCLLYRDNLREPIQILLAQKQKTFSHFFLSIFQIYIKFSTFSKKDDPHSRCPKNYHLRKRWLDECLQNPVLEVNFTTNMAKGPKDC